MEASIRSEEKQNELFPQSLVTPTKGQARRSILQIRMEILKVVQNGSGKPTQIMYKANLSWTVLQAQLRAFTKSGLLRIVEYGNRRRYEITDQGVEMIRSYDKVIGEVLKEA